MIPFRSIETLFLDMGNTIISIDFDRVASELATLGLEVGVDRLRRAEAASRPGISKLLANGEWLQPEEPFVVYLRGILARLGHEPGPAAADRDGDLVPRLASRLRGERASSLWSAVMPGVPAALATFRRLGLRLAVVSNSDGTVEETLVRTGLRHHFDAVVDSAVVGCEKPDPRIFALALERCGGTAEATLHVGDLYHADVVGARRAGLHAVLLDPYDDWHDVDCARVQDLPALARRFDAETPRRPGAPPPASPRE